jgi:hypothetical protein
VRPHRLCREGAEASIPGACGRALERESHGMVRVGYPANARIAGQRESVRDEVFCQAAGITGNAGGCGTSAVSAEAASGLGDLKGGEGCFVTRDSVLSDVKLREFFRCLPAIIPHRPGQAPDGKILV